VYMSCVRSCMTYGSETWPLKVEHEATLETIRDMRMNRWMCGVSLRDRIHSEDLRDWVGVEPIGEVCRRNRLRWFGHVERKEDDDWVSRVYFIQLIQTILHQLIFTSCMLPSFYVLLPLGN
jgi:hypothetical protein